ncbi:hypothetical protein, partial [Paraburkholderia caribensis]|uniref:hypothetical protein n=1 Tax=Paraburkholderia caribensis TaxID=75105 RepID=UPI003F494284
GCPRKGKSRTPAKRQFTHASEKAKHECQRKKQKTPTGVARASHAPTTKQSNKNTKKPTNNTQPEDSTSKPRRTLTLTCPRDADKLKRVVRKGMSGQFGKSSAGGGSAADRARPGSGM